MILGARPNVKILLDKNVSTLRVSGLDLKSELPLKKQTKLFKGQHTLKINCLLPHNKFPSSPQLVASLGSQTGLTSIGKKKYSGRLHVWINPEKKGCLLVQETNMETYLANLLSKEMNSEWPMEVLKAQAVAARTFALYRLQKKGAQEVYHLENSEKDQVGGHFLEGTMKTHMAALSTRGEVLKNSENKLVPAFFHAKCGGRTFGPQYIWQNPISGYKSVKCPYCHETGPGRFKKSVTKTRFLKFLHWLDKKKMISSLPKGFEKKYIGIMPGQKFSPQIVLYFEDKPLSINKGHFRKYFGRFLIPSNFFKLGVKKLKNKKTMVQFLGEGRGHGVGLCQIGALQLAKRGMKYKNILAHYYPQFSVKKHY